ncbi:MAG: two pore domain potassium channel family protein [Bacteroidales bacterium]|jgi:hypothetical protein|nr:two pore domain potassium channel family protein [Bacteroidales bacterium]
MGGCHLSDFITVSRVGFEEVIPLSDARKFFTSFLILGNLGFIAWFISVSSKQLTEMQMYFPGYHQKSNQKKWRNMKSLLHRGEMGSRLQSN